jgi:hypothetical protein
MSKVDQLKHDAEDGEIQRAVEFPLECCRMTRRQLMRCANELTETLGHRHQDIVDAIQGGLRTESASKVMSTLEEFRKQRRTERLKGISPDNYHPKRA